MATNMQPLFSALPSSSTQALQEARDRQPAFQEAEPARNFESILGRAEARQAFSKHDAPVRQTERTGIHTRPAARGTRESSNQDMERSTVSETHEQTMKRSERAGEKAQQSAEESTENDATQESKKSHDQGALSQDILLAAMIAPTAPATPVEAPPAEAETGVQDSEGAVPVLAAPPEDCGAEGCAPMTSLTALSATSAAAETSSAPEAVATAQPSKESTQTKVTPGKDMVQTEGKDMLSVVGQIPLSEGRPAERVDPTAWTPIAPDRLDHAVSSMTASQQNPQNIEPGLLDQTDRSALLEALAQGTTLSEGQAGSGAGGFMEQEGQSFSDSDGTDRSLPNQTASIEQNTRPAFLDRMNGLNQPASSVSESSPGRSESGQTAGVLRAAEAERVNELRVAAPVSHSVMLDLDPLDMGPLRVRVMMSDQTVHAHIRTEHGELGQGLLQQGQSLETSLRTTGLEMGMLRVTVDQQQGRGDNAWMFQQQQQQGRPATPNMSQAAAREDERAARGERSAGSNERVSFFA